LLFLLIKSGLNYADVFLGDRDVRALRYDRSSRAIEYCPAETNTDLMLNASCALEWNAFINV